MICSNCGAENPPDKRFCGDCGTPLAAGCPSCGALNQPDKRFCGDCGTALAPSASQLGAVTSAATPRIPGLAATVAERRHVTVLFADLVGFTPFAEERDAEEVRDTLTRYFELASEIIARYGGTVEKFIGDAVMAVWGAPVAHEDDAERAVRAGLELVDSVRALGPAIQARAGVLTGEAAVTIGATNQGMVAGDLVNTASRLQSVAPPGAVLVGEATFHAATRAIAFEPAGEQALKGKTSPVPAWRALRIVAERGGRNRTETLEAPFVGRDDELRLLKDLFHATGREKRARLVSVTGIGGVGKSRLAWEFVKYLDGLVEQVWWHHGRSPAYGEGVTFWALGEMVRGRANLLETDDEATTRAKVAEMVTTHVPDESERRWIEPAVLALLGLESSIASEQLFAAWRAFFERLSATGTVMMVFEDLQWADAGLLDFIDSLLEWSRAHPIYVVTLARPELRDKRPDWGAGKRSFTSVYLEPLPQAAMRALLAGLVPGLPEPNVEAIVTRADGIPLYAVETVRMLLAEGKLEAQADGTYTPAGDLSSIAVPGSLTALIAARLDGLDPADRALVQDAAVLGQSFTLAGLAAVSGIAEAGLEARLRGLVRRELLTIEADPRSPERGQYAFVQALIREVAYNTLAHTDRKTRHLAAARYLESLGSEEIAGGLAGHYLAARRLASDGAEADTLAAQARVTLRAAAERAAALGSHEQALGFLDQALQVTIDAAERGDLHERALRSARAGTDADVAERHAQGAVEAFRAAGDREGIARATAQLGYVLADYRFDPKRALGLLLPAWEEFADLEQTPAGVGLMSAIQRCYGGADDADAQYRWAERLLPAAEKLGLMEAIVGAIHGKSAALGKAGRAREASVLLEGAHALAIRHDLPWVEQRTRVGLTFRNQWIDPGRGLALAREGQEIAQRLGSRAYSYAMVGNGVFCAIRTGDWEWAEAQLEHWLADGPPPATVLELLIDRAIVTALHGGDPTADLEATEPELAKVTDPQYRSYHQLALAWFALAEGRLADAMTAAQSAAAASSYFQPIAFPVAARAALWASDPDRARSVLDLLDASGSQGSALDLDRASMRAGLLALVARSAEALTAYRDVLRGWRGLGLAFDEALTVIDMATLLDPSDAEVRAAGDAAREILARLEARPFVERLDAALAARPVGSAPGRPLTEERRPGSELPRTTPVRGSRS